MTRQSGDGGSQEGPQQGQRQLWREKCQLILFVALRKLGFQCNPRRVVMPSVSSTPLGVSV